MNKQQITRVCIVHPADPMGISTGGIDPFIRGILRWAPDDLHFSVVGVSTDTKIRPLGKWTNCSLGDRTFDFFPIVKFENSGRQSRIPLIMRYIIALFPRSRRISADVLEFHRVESSLPLLRHRLPMTVVMHQNMQVLWTRESDIRWKYCPSLYFKLEDYVLRRVQSIFCVREDAAENYRKRFPNQSDHISFTPTWADTESFQPPSATERRQLRESVLSEFNFPDDSCLFVSVGRLDSQKNPILLINAFNSLHQRNPETRLLLVGDGVLRGQVEKRVGDLNLTSHVAMCGLKSAAEVARYLKAANVFILSSAYEGMPISVLEALSSGLPVASTDVGEVSRVVEPGVNGELTAIHEPGTVAEAMERCMRNAEAYRGRPCYGAIARFTPQKVLSPIYENYRRLAASSRQ